MAHGHTIDFDSVIRRSIDNALEAFSQAESKANEVEEEFSDIGEAAENSFNRASESMNKFADAADGAGRSLSTTKQIMGEGFSTIVTQLNEVNASLSQISQSFRNIGNSGRDFASIITSGLEQIKSILSDISTKDLSSNITQVTQVLSNGLSPDSAKNNALTQYRQDAAAFIDQINQAIPKLNALYNTLGNGSSDLKSSVAGTLGNLWKTFDFDSLNSRISKSGVDNITKITSDLLPAITQINAIIDQIGSKAGDLGLEKLKLPEYDLGKFEQESNEIKDLYATIQEISGKLTEINTSIQTAFNFDELNPDYSGIQTIVDTIKSYFDTMVEQVNTSLSNIGKNITNDGLDKAGDTVSESARTTSEAIEQEKQSLEQIEPIKDSVASKESAVADATAALGAAAQDAAGDIKVETDALDEQGKKYARRATYYDEYGNPTRRSTMYLENRNGNPNYRTQNERFENGGWEIESETEVHSRIDEYKRVTKELEQAIKEREKVAKQISKIQAEMQLKGDATGERQARIDALTNGPQGINNINQRVNSLRTLAAAYSDLEAGSSRYADAQRRIDSTMRESTEAQARLQQKLYDSSLHDNTGIASVQKDYDTYATKIEQAIQKVVKAQNDWKAAETGTASADYSRLADLATQLDNLKQNLDGMAKGDVDAALSGVARSIEEIESAIRAANEASTVVTSGTAEYDNYYSKIHQWLQKITKAQNDWSAAANGDSSASYSRLEDFKTQLQDILQNLNGMSKADVEGAIAKISKGFEEAETKIRDADEAHKSFLGSLTDLKALAAQYLTPMRVFEAAIRIGKDVVKSAIEIQDALVDLQIVTGETGDKFNQYTQNVSKSAQAIGVATKDVITATTTYARLGYSLDESNVLAKYTAMLEKVGAVSAEDAQNSVTAILAAFPDDADLSNIESIMDRLVTVGNNFPISVEQIAAGMNNASSSLAAAGNSFNESVALLAAANVTIQNASKSSTGLRTIAARIQNTTADLEALGESDFTEAKYQELVQALTNYHVSLLDINGEYRSTYDIMADIAAQWDTMNSKEKAALATAIAGTRQQAVFYSLIENFDNVADKAMQRMSSSDGALEEAYSHYMDTITAHIEQFKAALNGIGTNIITPLTPIINTIIDLGSVILNVIDIIAQMLGPSLKGLSTGISVILSPIKMISDAIVGLGESSETASGMLSLLSSGLMALLAVATNHPVVAGLIVLGALITQIEEAKVTYEEQKKIVADLEKEYSNMFDEGSRYDELTQKVRRLTAEEEKELAVLEARKAAMDLQLAEEREKEYIKFQSSDQDIGAGVYSTGSGMFGEITTADVKKLNEIEKKINDIDSAWNNNQMSVEEYQAAVQSLVAENGDIYSELIKQKGISEQYNLKPISDAQKQFIDLYEEQQDRLVAVNKMAADPLIVASKKLENFEIANSKELEELRQLSEGGTVDLTIRPRIDQSELIKAGWDSDEYGLEEGGIATVFSTTASNEAGTIATNFTPIIVDEKGKYVGALSPDALQQYAEEVIGGVREDDLRLQVGAVFEGEDAIEEAAKNGIRVHELHELVNTETYAQLQEAYNIALADSAKKVETLEVSFSNLKSTMSGLTAEQTALNNAITEQGSNQGLSFETYQELIKSSSDYANCLTFENGVMRINTELALELFNEKQKLLLNEAELNRALTIDEYSKRAAQLSELQTKYSELSREQREEIATATNELNNLGDQIHGYDLLISKLNDATSAYSRWKNAQNMPESGDLYDDLKNAQKQITEGLESGKTGTLKYRMAVELMVPDDHEVEEYQKTIARYFTDDSTGVSNFIADMIAKGLAEGTVESAVIKEGINWSDITEALGITRDVAEAIIGELQEYGATDLDLKILEDGEEQRVSEAVTKIRELNEEAAKVQSEIDELLLKQAEGATGDDIQNQIDTLQAKLDAIAAERESLIPTQSTTDELNNVQAQLETLQAEITATAGKHLGDLGASATISALEGVKSQLNDINGIKLHDKTIKINVDDSAVKAAEANAPTNAQASGTRNAPGGRTLVNELGPELISQNGRAFIANGGDPAIVDLSPGAIVLNADETKSALKHSTVNNGINAFASGGRTIGVNKPSGGWGGGGGSASPSSASQKSTSDTSSPEKEETWFERQYKYHKHLIEMDQELQKDFLDWLDDAYKRAYAEGIIDLDEYRDKEEEVYKGRQDLFKDYLSDLEHTIDMAEKAGEDSGEILKIYQEMLNDVNIALEEAYARGLDENDDYVQYLQDQWYSYYDKLKDAQDSAKDDAMDAVDDLVQYRIKMLKQYLKDEVDSLKERLSNLKDFYSKQKKMLQDVADTEDYLDDQSEKRKKISDIESQLTMLELDNSAWAQKRKAQLKEELSKAQEELNKFERDHAIEVASEQLDAAYDVQERAINARIDQLDDLANNPKYLYEQALKDVQNNSIELYEEMIEFNNKYGDGIQQTIVDKWEQAYISLKNYSELYHEFYKGIDLVNATNYQPGTEDNVGGNYIARNPGGAGVKTASLLEPEVIGGGAKSEYSDVDPQVAAMIENAQAAMQANLDAVLSNIQTAQQAVLQQISDNTTSAFGDLLNNSTSFGNISMGDIIINGNATEETVSEIRRAQRDNVSSMLKALNTLKNK